MAFYDAILNNLPEVQGPQQKRLSFKEKLKWTLMVLVLYFIMGAIPLFGIGQFVKEQFEFISIILGAKFGSIISLGIGPIVTGSIILQLLQGSGLVKFDTSSTEGRKRYQGVQKLTSFFFVIFEAFIYVYMNALPPEVGISPLVIVFQLILGGIMIMFLDEVVTKWGFGHGISLFIAAGVSEEIFIRGFSWFHVIGPGGQKGEEFIGALPELIRVLPLGDTTTVGLKIAAILGTIIVFAMAVYGQAMKIEIPLSFGRIRGHGIRWPLAFIYTSNIPVILVAALLANVQLLARFFQNWTQNSTGIMLFISEHIIGRYQGTNPASGLVKWVSIPGGRMGLIGEIITNGFAGVPGTHYLQALTYMIFMIIGSVIFAIFWVQTSGMDAKSQAKQIMDSGLQMPGFRRDPRVLEYILNRYIWPLTIMGGITVGFLASFADLAGALSRGTGILLAVMIIYKLYEEVAKQHMMDMHPAMRRFME
tara:strand:- start:19 stop:1449 length:1431 start_codon:yes stop_codon:yes gene_type:complete